MTTNNLFTSNLEEKIQLYNKIKLLQEKDASNIQTPIERNQSPSFTITDNKNNKNTLSPIQQFNNFSRNNHNNNLSKNHTLNLYNKNDLSSISNAKILHRTRSDYLYENSKMMLSKMELQRRKNEEKITKNRTPEITIKAKSIKRNPHLFSERLYPCPHKPMTIDVNELYGTNQRFYNPRHKIIKDEQFEFKPQINKVSKKIAAKLESPRSRLLKKPKKTKNQFNSTMTLEIEIVEKKYKKLTLPTFDKSLTDNKTRNKSPSLYIRGMEMIKKHNEIAEENKKENEKHYLQFSFKPNITPSNYYKSNTIKIHPRAKSVENNSDTIEEFYKRNARWKEAIEAKNKKIQNDKKKKELTSCTFTPKINKGLMNNDTKFIEKNIGQIVSYVKKRKNFLKLKEEEELYKNKIFYNNYIPHTTNKIKTRTNSYSRNYSKNKSVCIVEECDFKQYNNKK